MKKIELLPCPECGNLPKLKRVVNEYKYFCGVHVSCGDWKPSKKEAAKDWNRRTTWDGQPGHYKPTNADRIRTMSDAELAKFLAKVALKDWDFRSLYGGYSAAYDFLKQPAQKELE